MKIFPVTNNFYTNNLYKRDKIDNDTITNPISNTQTIYASYYPIAFSGGKSLCLKETKEALDSKITENFNPYPKSKGLKKYIDDVLAEGNPQNKTLIDVHKEYFSRLEKCETLDEIKREYPEEFSEVLSDKEITKNPFIQAVKKDKIKGFLPDTDVSVQLIQLYWGKGLSTSYLKENFMNVNFATLLEKLNIPRVSRQYGEYLKYSDKDYNTYYTSVLSDKIKDTERIKQEKIAGIDIPQRSLSNEEKAKISEGLRKYYSEHPERIHEMSSRLIKFYEEHPEERNTLSIVMLRAWGYPEAKVIREKLSETLRKYTLTEDDIKESTKPLTPMNKAFKVFWNNNEWAKSVLSVCVRRSWAEQAALQNNNENKQTTYQMSPVQIKDKILSYTKEKAPELSTYMNKHLSGEKETDDAKQRNQANAVIVQFFNENPKEYQNLMYSRLFGMITAFTQMAHKNITSKGALYSNLNNIIKIYEKYIKQKNGTLDKDISSMYYEIFKYCAKNNDNSLEIINKSIDETYSTVSNLEQADIIAYGNSKTKELLDLLPYTYRYKVD